MTVNKSKKKRVAPNYNPYPSGVYSSFEAKSIGSVFLLKPLLDSLGLKELIDEICPLDSNRAEVSVGETCVLAVLNRLHSPQPLYRLEEWANNISTFDLYGIPHKLFNESKVGRTLETLAANMDAIDFALLSLLVTKYDIKPSMCLWDSTSYYFEGKYSISELLRNGYSRDGHPECKQVNIGLCVDAESGVPLQYKLAPGNTADVEMVVDHLECLKTNLQKLNLPDFIAVTDRALTSIDNIFALENNDDRIQFIAPASSDTIYLDLISTVKETDFQRFHYRDMIFKVAERGILIRREKNKAEKEYKWFRAIVVYSPTKFDVDRQKRNKALDKIDTWISDLLARKINVRKYKQKTYVEKMFEAQFKGFNSKYKKAYTLTITGADGSLTATVEKDDSVIDALKEYDGKYVLLSNIFKAEFDPITLFKHSRRRTDIEIRMRYLKHQIKVRPIFLEKDERIVGLTIVTNIALTVFCLLEELIRRAGMNISARELLLNFSQISLTKAEHSDGTYVNNVENALPYHYKTLEELGLMGGDYKNPYR